MSIEVKVPVLPESVADATVAAWHKKIGDTVVRGENLVDLETDKVVLEVPAPGDGVLEAMYFQQGDTVNANEVLARLGDQLSDKTAATKTPEPAKQAESKPSQSTESSSGASGPSVRRLLSEHALSADTIQGSGKGGRLTKEDVFSFIESKRQPPQMMQEASTDQLIKRVPMTRLRAKIAQRLVQAQHEAAMLTTFNEVNMQAVMDLRAQYKDVFEKKHGVKLGFMSFFTKAVVEALKRFPAVNACIDGQDIVYHGYYDIGIAVSTPRGLVVPIIRGADNKSMSEIEKAIQDAATKAKEGKLSIEEMQGGTFTITNGGIFGSLLSTPIINPPQVAILGMHKIQERPVVEAGQIVARPMMYVALSYDHRLIDGQESVQFLVSVKELLENPARLLLNV